MKFVIAVTVLLLASGLSSVHACSCLPSGPPCQAYWNYTDVFVGRALSVKRVEIDWEGDKIPQQLIQFRIEELFRGEKRTTVDVVTGMGGGDCGYNFEPGKRYLVYGRTIKGKPLVDTGICTRTRPIADAKLDLKYLRALSTQPSGARIFGTAHKFTLDSQTGAWVRPVPLTGLTVVAASDKHSFRQATRRNGTFAFRNLPPGQYTVRATMPPRLSPAEDQTVEVHDRGCFEVDYRVVVDGRISGRLLDAAGGPMAIKTVDLISVTGERGRQFWTITEEDGRFQFEKLPAGKYILGLNINDAPSDDLPYKQTFYVSTLIRPEAKVISLAEGERLSGIDFRLGPALIAGQITGVVVWPNGQPANGAEVTLTEQISNRDAKWGIKTDTNGHFTVPAFQGVAYRISATIPADPTWNPESGRSVALLATQTADVTPYTNMQPIRLVIDVGDDGIKRTKVTVGEKSSGIKRKRSPR